MCLDQEGKKLLRVILILATLNLVYKVSVCSGQGSSEPTNFAAQADGPFTISARWNSPSSPNGVLYEYIVKLTKHGATTWSNFLLSPTTEKFIFKQLTPYTLYYIKVRASTDGGNLLGRWSKTIEVRTKKYKVPPVVAPSLVDIDFQKMLIHWYSPYLRYGAIDKYKIKIEGSKDYNKTFSDVRSFEVYSSNFEVLAFGYTLYKVTVIGVNSFGEGFPATIVQTSPLGVPLMPKIKVTEEEGDYFIAFYPVSDLNGPISFYESARLDIGNDCKVSFANLTGTKTKVHAFDPLEIPKKVKVTLGEVNLGNTSLTLPLRGDYTFCYRAVSKVKEQTKYSVINNVTIERRSLEKPIRQPFSPGDSELSFRVVLSHLNNTKYVQLCVAKLNGSQAPTTSPLPWVPSMLKPYDKSSDFINKPYIAAEISASDFSKYQTFVVGDKRSYPSYSGSVTYKNVALEGGVYYTLFQRAFVSSTDYYTGPWLSPVMAQGYPSEPRVNVTVNSSTNITISWKPPNKLNGIIAKYRLNYSSIEALQGKMFQREKEFGHATATHVITGLKPYSKVSIKMRAFTQGGAFGGDWSDEITVQTEEQSPSSPNNVTTHADGPFAINVTWKTPSMPNGLIHQYTLQLSEGSLLLKHFNTSADVTYLNIKGLKPYIWYTVKIKAYTKGGQLEGPWSHPAHVRTDEYNPSKPNNVTVKSDGPFAINVTWTAPTIPNGVIHKYTLQLNESTSFFKEYDTLTNVTHLNIKGLKPYTWYKVKIKAYTKGGKLDGPWSHPVIVQTEEHSPSAPTNVNANYDGPFKINVTWEIPSIPNGLIHEYTLQLSEGSLLLKQFNTSADVTYLNIKGLKPYIRYTVKIKAYTKAGKLGGPWSHPAQARTDEYNPSEPNNVTVKSDGPFAINVTWTAPTVPNGVIHKYTLQLNESASFFKEYNTLTNETRLNIQALKPYTWYKVKIKAYTKGGKLNGPWSHPVKVQTEEHNPSQPHGVTAQDDGPFAINVTWKVPMTPNGLLHSYKLQVEKPSFSRKQYDISANNTHVNIKGLKPYTWYKVKVRAYTKGGKLEGPWSHTADVRTEEHSPSQPTNVSAKADSAFAINVTWKSPIFPNGVIYKYIIQLNDDLLFLNQCNTSSNETYLNIKGLKPYTLYYVKIKAFTKGGNLEGSWSYSAEVQTEEHRSSMVRSIKLKSESNLSSVILAWYPPSLPNGLVRKYRVMMKGFKSYNKSFSQAKNATVENTNLVLRIFGNTFYDVRIIPINGWGEGDQAIFNFTTPIGVPPTPEIKITKSNKGQAITLYPASDINGHIAWYELAPLGDVSNCTGKFALSQKSSNLVTIHDLASPKVINVALGEEGLRGVNLSLALIGNHTLCFRAVIKDENVTNYGIPSWSTIERRSLPKLTTKSKSKSSGLTFDVVLSTFSIADLQFIQVCVMKLGKGLGPTRTPESWSPSVLKPYNQSIIDYTNKPYIAAEFSMVDFEKLQVFTVGDGKSYSRERRVRKAVNKALDYQNVPLQKGSNYTLFQRVFKSPTVYYTGPWISPVLVEEEGTQEADGYVFYIALTLGVLILLIFIIMVFLCITKRNSRETLAISTKKKGDIPTSFQNNGYETTSFSFGSPEKYVSTKNTSNATFSFRRSACMTPTNFDYVVANCKIENEKGQFKYQEEFEQIQQECKRSKQHTYKNEKSRENGVKASPENIKPNADIDKDSQEASLGATELCYPDAVFIEGVNEGENFIAAKFPVPETIDEFWLMLFQQRIKHVIILVDWKRSSEDLEEFQGLPDFIDTPSTSSGILITTAEVVKHSALVELNVYIKKDNVPAKDSDFKCNFFFLSRCLERNVVAAIETVLYLACELKKAKFKFQGDIPIAVVSSDGVGRSGCLIAILMALDCLATKGFCDIKQVVKRLKDNRPQFVENADQYLFCYEAVAAYLQKETLQRSHTPMKSQRVYENLPLDK